jgi:hypothetical protein
MGEIKVTTLAQSESLEAVCDNLMQIMRGDVTHILQDKVSAMAAPFIDDVSVKGPATWYKLADRTYKTIAENPGIHQSIWEHMGNMNQILQRMKANRGTFNRKKLVICTPEATVVGHLCSYNGRILGKAYVQWILDWLDCQNVSDVRSFMGTCGMLNIGCEMCATSASICSQALSHA